MALDDFDRGLIAATQRGLPLVPRPYDAVGEQLGVSGAQVRERLAQLLETGLVRRIGAGVSHCYRRPRRLPVWPYNLFAMLHGRTRAEVEHQAVQLKQLLGNACHGHDILYSTAILKKTGLRLNHPSSVKES